MMVDGKSYTATDINLAELTRRGNIHSHRYSTAVSIFFYTRIRGGIAFPAFL